MEKNRGGYIYVVKEKVKFKFEADRKKKTICYGTIYYIDLARAKSESLEIYLIYRFSQG